MIVSEDSFRLALDTYPIHRDISVRVCDLDGYGHLNAIRIGHFYEDARAAFYGSAFNGLQSPRLLVAQITLRYLREGHWPGTLQVGTGISRIGSSSIEMIQGLFDAGQRCLGLCETILVNTGGSGSAPLPAAARAAFGRMLIREPSEA